MPFDTEFIKARQTQLNSLAERLGRTITPEEQQQELAKPICAHCFKLETADDHFETCEDCRCVSYCCSEHKQLCLEKHTASVCKSLRFAKSCDELLYQSFGGVYPVYVSPQEELQYNENIMAGGWDAYLKYRVSPTMRDMYSKLASASSRLGDLLSSYENDLSPSLEAIITENLSFPMTVLFGLHQLFHLSEATYQKNFLSVMSFVPRFGKTLIVHVIGAANVPELVGTGKYEEILHLLPHVQTLELVFIGPEMAHRHRQVKQTLFGRSLAITCVHGLYHVAVSPGSLHSVLPQHLRKPHLAVAYNCGVHDTQDSWSPTITFLVNNNIPTAFTSFTEDEAAADAKIISKCGANVIYSSKNPFSSRRLLCDSSIPTGDTFCTNSYITMIHGATTSTL